MTDSDESSRAKALRPIDEALELVEVLHRVRLQAMDAVDEG